ncbi:sensor histidine kinase [Alteromonas facilis]|uniref:sensor histidine kinase n=1 Tax=Alteromonas facilis TaxID=2048004 RepID=UPI0013D91622|nr:ATP-binding protein [Alteromonas facilis]
MEPKAESQRSNNASGLSLESELKYLSILFLLIVTALFVLVAYFADLSLKLSLSIFLILIIGLGAYLLRVYRRVVQPMDNLVNIIEAIRLEDYGLSPRLTFKQGVMAQLLSETANLVEVLQQRKERYNQQIYLIYRLIEQLDLPVMVFDEKLRLSHGNEAFGNWYGQPWGVVKGLSCKRIGLDVAKNGRWQFINPDIHQGWQIRSSRFANGRDIHQLIILNNIKSEVRQVQQDAWQQIIRVLTHEIRNSLTPICSMTELMLDTPELDEKLRTPLQVIDNRSTNLLNFVERYADTAKSIKVVKKELATDTLIKKICPLFPDNSIQFSGPGLTLFADPVLLEQVLINLIRNGMESQRSNKCKDPVIIEFDDTEVQTTIRVKDKGVGIANPSNLFVPFYTTKEGGQGIGLTLCRKIVEQHQGSLTLSNRSDGGAIATIHLPKEKTA